MPTLVLVGVEQTGWSCPSSWEAVDIFGGRWYLRYRSGVGTVTPANRVVPLISFDTGDSLDGTMDLITFARCARIVLGLN